MAESDYSFSLWPTPTTRDYRTPTLRLRTTRAGEGTEGEHLSNFVAHLWATPTVADVTGGRKTRGGSRKTELLLNGQAEQLSAFFHPAPTTGLLGLVSSPEPRRLNPRFVEWLMGFPTGWTACGCSAPALFRFKRRMRSALWRLSLPDVLPAQLALFG